MKLIMRHVMLVVLAGLLIIPSVPAAQPAVASSPAVRVVQLAEEYTRGFFDFFPELETYYGLPGSRHDRLHDGSSDARRRWRAKEDSWSAQLAAVDPAKLEESEWVTYQFLREALDYGGFLRESLETGRETRICRRELWSLDHSSGWTGFFYPAVAAAQPVGTPERRAQALARWRAFPRLVDQEIQNLREGRREGYTAPRRTVQLVISQIDGVLQAAVSGSPFYSPAVRDGDARFVQQWTSVVSEQIHPALRRYRDFLRADYLPGARESIGASALPRGDRCYRALLRRFTTLDLSPEALRAAGLEELDRIANEERTIVERSFRTADVASVRRQLQSDSKYFFRTREEMAAVARGAMDRSRRAMVNWVGLLPKSSIVLDPYLPAEEGSAGNGAYLPPSRDGTRPGRFRVNFGDAERRRRATLEVLTFHESLPGHHLQEAVALERDGALPLTRHFYTTAFNEGWAVYAERLAGEMGLYSTDLDRLGMLDFQARRAVRLVVDPGLHAFGWSRDEAIDFMARYLAEPREFIAGEVDEYIASPGFATPYMIGAREIARLRREAEQALGPRFDIRAFHSRVLGWGAGPLPMLSESVSRWLRGLGALPDPPASHARR